MDAEPSGDLPRRRARSLRRPGRKYVVVFVLSGLAIVCVNLAAWLEDDALGGWARWLSTATIGLLSAAAAVFVGVSSGAPDEGA